jgi:hypothetical protein
MGSLFIARPRSRTGPLHPAFAHPRKIAMTQHSSKHLALASLLVLFLVHPTAPLWA